MKKLIMILLAATLSSCLTYDFIKNNCDKFAQICVTDETVKIEYRDTTIYIRDTIFVSLPKDTVYINNTIIVENGIASMPKITKDEGIITVEAWIENSVLSVYAFLNDSTILVPRTDTVTVTTTNTTTTGTVVLPPEKFVPWFYKFTLWIFIAEVITIILFFLYKFGIIKINNIT